MNVRHDFGAREQRFFVVTSQGVNSSAVWPRLFVPGVQIDTPLKKCVTVKNECISGILEATVLNEF